MIIQHELRGFVIWLKANGAEIFPITNEHELIRFKAREIGVVYKSGKTNSTYTKRAIWCFKHNEQWDGKAIKTGRLTTYKRQKRLLLQRDGSDCFYCGGKLGEDISLEHLIPLSQEGKNTLSNMVLAHERCNQAVGNKTIVEKVNIAIKQRRA